MTVSRAHKRGRRAGMMRPSSRNKRVQRNATFKKITGEVDERPTAPKRSREEWVIRCVSRFIGTRKDLVTADDLASDILMELLDAGGFSWDEEEIEQFCRKRTSSMILKCLYRKERPECEFVAGFDDGRASRLIEIAGVSAAHQETHVHASDARRLLRAIPNAQRAAMEILCDGGNPIDVAEELGITAWAAITLIKEAREYVSRVDPIET